MSLHFAGKTLGTHAGHTPDHWPPTSSEPTEPQMAPFKRSSPHHNLTAQIVNPNWTAPMCATKKLATFRTPTFRPFHLLFPQLQCASAFPTFSHGDWLEVSLGYYNKKGLHSFFLGCTLSAAACNRVVYGLLLLLHLHLLLQLL